MIWSLSALQDATIYEKDPYRNTGLDQLLELRKEGDTTTGDLAESRILIKFDLASLSNILSENNITINDISSSLRLYTVLESELPKTYTIEAKALNSTWENGSGYYTYPTSVASNTITDGVTWVDIAGSGSATWQSLSTGTNGFVYNSEVGGGVWYTASIASQSFSFKTDNVVDIDVSDIVKSWYNGAFSNNGFLVTFKNSEITASNYPLTNIQFHSSETHTVYEPHLYISWTGSLYSTGSMSVVTYEDSPIIYTRTFKSEYYKDKKVRVLLGSRAKFPRPTFAQNSTFSTMKALPENSYYQIKDAHSDEVIIPFSEATKINCNSNGNYFDFYSTMMYPERYYKFEIKAVFDDITEYFNSNEFIFKITS